ncbi:MAG: glycosyltransferase family 10 domain-containing protein [Candidatus Helarchaeota archaeon]
MLKIKFDSDTPHHDTENSGWGWYKLWRRMAQNYKNYTWNDIQVVKPNEKADITIVINHPRFHVPEKYDRKNAITYQLEPKVVRKQHWWDYNNPSIKSGFLFCHNIDSHHMCIDWNVEYSYEELQTKPFPKNKILSTVQTWKDYYPGHKLRKFFLQNYLDNLNYIDIYGHLKQGKDWTYKQFKGELPVRKKESALAPYKYSFCCENSIERNYWTEKIVDALICECLPFYWGCKNLEDFLPKDCYIWLPLDDPELSLNIIETSIKNNEWKKRLPAIKKAKKLIMNKWQFFPDLEYHLKRLKIL